MSCLAKSRKEVHSGQSPPARKNKMPGAPRLSTLKFYPYKFQRFSLTGHDFLQDLDVRPDSVLIITGLFIPLATSHTLKLDHSDRRHFHASQDWILDFCGFHTHQLDTVHFGVYHIASLKRFLCHTAAGFLF